MNKTEEILSKHIGGEGIYSSLGFVYKSSALYAMQEYADLQTSSLTSELEALKAENERLRGALSRIENLSTRETTDDRGHWNAASHYKKMQEIAKAALTTEKEKPKTDRHIRECEKCNGLFVPHLMKPMTICDDCADELAREIKEKEVRG